jgi:hypothetical protein
MEVPKNGRLLLATLKNSPRKHQAERRCEPLIEESVYGIPDNLYLPTTNQGKKIPLTEFRPIQKFTKNSRKYENMNAMQQYDTDIWAHKFHKTVMERPAILRHCIQF